MRFIGLMVLCFWVISAQSKTLHVGKTFQLKTILSALNECASDDTIFVHSGIYREGNLTINKSIKLIGLEFPVLDGQNKFEILSIKSNDVLVEGFKVINSGNVSVKYDKNIHAIPSIIPGWDHTPRSKKEGLVMTGSDPYEFSVHIKKVLKNISNKPLENRLVFIKSWNEWAEGNYMEPDLKWGNQFLQKLKEELKS